MSEISYAPIIDDMTWSYSRIKSFEDCRYKFFLRYIKELDEDKLFYASYGSFVHGIIERYYRGQIKKEQMKDIFLSGFSNYVTGNRPKSSIVEDYIHDGVEYLRGFVPFKYEMVDVEKKVEFDLCGKHFIGFIDYLGKDGDDFVIIDNKSSTKLKPRSKRKKPTQSDMLLDDKLRQLYLYSAGIKKEYGVFPTKLCFNCFRSGEFIEEPFSEEKYNETIEWAMETIERIRDTDDFFPTLEFFYCRYLCGLNDDCCYNVANRGK